MTGGQEALLTRPLFGCLGEAESVRAIQEQRSLVQFLHRYQTTEANRFRRQDQLARVVETVEWWGLVGCQLCFAATGQREPDHDIHSCKRGVDSERARLLLRWLEGLDIPLSHHPRRRGDCSICAPFYPCREVAYGVHKAEARSPGRKAYWIKQFEEKPGPDGHCEHRPLIRQAIAALCTYDNQFLGKLLTKLASDRDNLDLSSEVDARKWFEQLAQIPHWRFWNILQIYESLIRAFYFRRNRSLGREPLCGFPDEPPGDMSYSLDLEVDSPSWNDSKEVDRWQASLDWWVGKCSFCAGRGLIGQHILHTLRECERGGAAKVKSELGIAMYYDGILPSSGCRNCHIPFDFCNSWAREEGGEWAMVRPDRLRCQYGPYLLADTIIGLFHCGKSEIQQSFLGEAEKYCEAHDFQMDFDGETVACSLSQCITVAGTEGSEMIRTLAVLTKPMRAMIGQGNQGGIDCPIEERGSCSISSTAGGSSKVSLGINLATGAGDDEDDEGKDEEEDGSEDRVAAFINRLHREDELMFE